MAPGESPAPFVVVTGNRIGAIGMWQSGLSFTIGLLLAAGSACALADSQARAEPGTKRPVQSFSLVELVEKASAEGQPGERPRISLVDLVSRTPEPLADKPVTVIVPNAPTESTVVSVQAPVAPAVVPRPVQSAPAPTGVWPAEPQTPEQPAPPTAPTEVVRTVPPASLSVYREVAEQSAALEPLVLTEFNRQPGRVRLLDAVHRALNEHPAIVESLSRLDAQQEQVAVARAGYWPQLRGGVNTGYRHTTGRSEEAFNLSASQMIYDFGKVSSAVDAAASGVDREQAGVLLAAEDLIRETAQAFIEARRYEELLELATQQIEAIAELEELATKRSALGASSVSDQVQARSRREGARAVQLQMQAQRDQWHRALENLTGNRQQLALDEAYPRQLEGTCQRLPEEFEGSPRVVMAEAERAEAEAAIRQARAEQRPTLSVNADFEHYFNRNNDGFQQLDDQEFMVSMNLTSNLFQGGALRARSRAAGHALYSATAAKDLALLELSRFFREARDRSRSLTDSLALQDERYDSIIRTQELYRHQYLSLGTRTLLDILNTEQEIFQTQVDKQNTLFDLRSLQIDCLYSVGGLRESFRASDALNNRVSTSRTEGRS